MYILEALLFLIFGIRVRKYPLLFWHNFVLLPFEYLTTVRTVYSKANLIDFRKEIYLENIGIENSL